MTYLTWVWSVSLLMTHVEGRRCSLYTVYQKLLLRWIMAWKFEKGIEWVGLSEWLTLYSVIGWHTWSSDLFSIISSKGSFLIITLTNSFCWSLPVVPWMRFCEVVLRLFIWILTVYWYIFDRALTSLHSLNQLFQALTWDSICIDCIIICYISQSKKSN